MIARLWCWVFGHNAFRISPRVAVMGWRYYCLRCRGHFAYTCGCRQFTQKES